MIAKPSWWKDTETFPRLKEQVTVKTYYGNPVKIPKVCEYGWNVIDSLKPKTKKEEQEVLDILKSWRPPYKRDQELKLVYWELYQE